MISNLKNLVYNLDKFNNSYSNTVKLKQNDIRTLEIHVYENGEELDLTGYTAVVKWVNANNTVAPLTTSNIEIKNNTIFVKMIADCTRSSGVAKWELVLSKNNSIDYSFTQEVKILESVIQGQEESKNVANIIEELNTANTKGEKTLNDLEEYAKNHSDITQVTEDIVNLKNNKTNLTDFTLLSKYANEVTYPYKMRCAHRGFHKGYISSDGNTTSAIVQSKTYGFNWVELDCRITKDGYVVCCHDNKYNGLTISQTNYADLGDILNFGTAVQLLALLDLGVTLDIKDSSVYTWNQTFDIVANYIISSKIKCLFIGNYTQLKYVQTKFPHHLKILTGKTSDNWTDEELKSFTEVNNIAINVDVDNYSESYNHLVKRNGYKLSLQDTEDNTTRLTRTEYKECDYVCTDWTFNSLYPELDQWLTITTFNTGVTQNTTLNCPVQFKVSNNHCYLRGVVNATVGSKSVSILNIPSDLAPTKGIRRINPSQGVMVNRTLITPEGEIIIEWCTGINKVNNDYPTEEKWHQIEIDWEIG